MPLRAACYMRVDKSFFLFSLIFFLVAAYFLSCDSRHNHDVLECLPDDLKAHLTCSDDSTLAYYSREAGFDFMSKQYFILRETIADIPPKDIDHLVPRTVHYLAQLAIIMESEFQEVSFAREIQYFSKLDPEEIFNSVILRRRMRDLYKDDSISPSDKIELISEYIEVFERTGYTGMLAMAKNKLAELYGDIGDEEMQFVLLKEASREFEKHKWNRMRCQTLGTLGSIYRSMGDVDSMIICYEKALDIANRSRLPNQTARILTFYAGYYRKAGRYALAHRLYSEAEEVCREYKGGAHLLRFVLESMDFYADLGCWEIVERLNGRLKILLRLYSWDNHESKLKDLYTFRMNLFNARMLMAEGNVIEAEKIMTDIEGSARKMRSDFRGEYVRLMLPWARGLYENGRYEDAEPIINKGIHNARQNHLLTHEVQFYLLLAQSQLELGNLEKADSTLLQFDKLAAGCTGDLKLECINSCAARGRLELLRGNRKDAVSAAENGLDRLAGYAAGMDGSVHTYLAIGKCEDLRMLMHDLVSDNPTAGYGAELLWKDLYRLLGTGNNGIDSAEKRARILLAGSNNTRPGALIEYLHERGIQAIDCIVSANAVHTLYLVRDHEISRWTVSKRGIRSEFLDSTTEIIQKLVYETRNMLMPRSNEGSDEIQPELTDNLQTLAEILLPPEALERTGRKPDRLFLFTAEGFLSSIPFDALDIGKEKDYVPLILHADVALLRNVDCSPMKRNDNPGLILAHSGRLLQDDSAFLPELSGTITEAEAVAAHNPDAIFLKNESATKDNLMRSWETASFLYFATHIMTDPEVPYMVHIPLTPPQKQNFIEDTFLDITDIRSANLSGCGLVVLSGCSSGVPYTKSHFLAPSLCDAFLDSGAHVVFHTLLDIPDEAATYFMLSSISLSKGIHTSSAKFLCQNKRNTIRDSSTGLNDSFFWAACSVSLGSLYN